jgi:hypothetical protein
MMFILLYNLVATKMGSDYGRYCNNMKSIIATLVSAAPFVANRTSAATSVTMEYRKVSHPPGFWLG